MNDTTKASGNRINKLNYTSSAKSNVSSLGTVSMGTNATNGLAQFNLTLKNTIKYLYLNNNSLINVNALSDFKALIEIELFCNPGLNDISGLSGKNTIECLTLHSCNIESLGSLSGMTNLCYLTFQSNTSVSSLDGIEGLNDLRILGGSDCNITDLSALEGKTSLWCLDLRNNFNLENVSYIKNCTGLTKLYLKGNENMELSGLQQALNSTLVQDNKTVTLFSRIQGLTALPQKYWQYFENLATVLDYSYITLNSFLEDDSDAFVALKYRVDVISLNLNGQTHLTASALLDTLETMTGLEILGLKDTKINSDSFVKSGSKLRGIDLYGTAVTSLTNIENYATNLSNFTTDNSSINYSDYSILVNRLMTKNSSLFDTLKGHSYYGYGLIFENASQANQALSVFSGSSVWYHAHDCDFNGDIDLSSRNTVTSFYSCRLRKWKTEYA